MKKKILTVFFFAAFTSLNPCDAQPPPAQTPPNAPSKPESPQASNPPIRTSQPSAVQSSPVNIQSQAAATSPATAPPITTTPHADIGSLIAKEILSANNQVVSQVASLYQNLGLFITIIVTLVAGIASWVSYTARKSVQEFIQEWTEKVKSLESDMKEDLKRLRNAVAEAEGSAKKAAEHEKSIEDSNKILGKILKNYDRLRAIPSLATQLRGEEERTSSSQPVTGATLGQPLQEALAPEEDAEVADLLKGKIDPSEGEGQNS